MSIDEDNDEAEDALTPEFRKLLSTVSREAVDKQPTRCPHPETAERMTKVLYCLLPRIFVSGANKPPPFRPPAHPSRKRSTRLHRRHDHLRTS